MEVRYKREMNHNYMILDAPEGENGYECRMLAGNQIEGLLKFRVRHSEEKREFYYEITSRQPLNRILEKQKATGEEVRRVLLAVVTAVSRIEEYLLTEEQLLLAPEYIYVDPDRFTVELCLLPGYTCDWASELSSLLQFLLEKVDHQDREGVILAYNLYQESRKENYGAADLLKHLLPGEDRIFSAGKKNPETEKTKNSNQSLGDKSVGTGGFREELSARKEWKQEWKQEETQNERKEQPENLPPQTKTRKSNHRRRMSVFIKGLCVLAAGETVLWYLTGSMGLRRYGSAAAIVFLALLFLMCLFSGKNASEEREKSSKKVFSRGSETGLGDHILVSQEPSFSTQDTGAGAGTSPWELQVESEDACRARLQQKEEEIMQKSREEGTVLLGSFGKSDIIGVLEPLGREGESIEISYVPFVIGKHPELTDCCLNRPTVSRLHLRIDKKENVCIITDLNSTNGTTVNTYQLQANETVSIKTGDTIHLADLGFRFWEK